MPSRVSKLRAEIRRELMAVLQSEHAARLAEIQADMPRILALNAQTVSDAMSGAASLSNSTSSPPEPGMEPVERVSLFSAEQEASLRELIRSEICGQKRELLEWLRREAHRHGGVEGLFR